MAAQPTYQPFWNFYQQGWSGFGLTYNGASGNVWLDDIKLFSDSKTLSPVSDLDFMVGPFWNGEGGISYSDYKITAVTVWPYALTDAQFRQAYAALVARGATYNDTITPKRIYVAEGDSITAGNGASSYVQLFAPNANPIVWGFNNAVSGSAISDLNNRAPALDAIIPQNPNGRNFILSVLIGHNDLIANPNTTQFLSKLTAYLDARRAAGWTVVVGTLLPSTVTGFNAERDTVNATIRTWVGVHADAIADFAADPTMGPDSAAASTTLYSDGTHPTDAGYVLLERVLQPVINGL